MYLHMRLLHLLLLPWHRLMFYIVKTITICYVHISTRPRPRLSPERKYRSSSSSLSSSWPSSGSSSSRRRCCCEQRRCHPAPSRCTTGRPQRPPGAFSGLSRPGTIPVHTGSASAPSRCTLRSFSTGTIPVHFGSASAPSRCTLRSFGPGTIPVH